MKNAPQTDTQSVWEHGVSVRNYLFDLLDHLRKGTPLKYEWRLPDWINDPILLENLPDDADLTIGRYPRDATNVRNHIRAQKNTQKYAKDSRYSVYTISGRTIPLVKKDVRLSPGIHIMKKNGDVKTTESIMKRVSVSGIEH